MWKIFKSAFAIALAMVFTNADNDVRIIILSFLGVLFIFFSTAIAIAYILRNKITHSFLQGIVAIILTFFFYICLFVLYKTYVFSSPPYSGSLLEKQAIIKILKPFSVRYNKNISLWDYKIYADRYRKDLQNSYQQNLTTDQKEKIWKNYLEMNLLVDQLTKLSDKLHSVIYQDKTFSYELIIYYIEHSYDVDGISLSMGIVIDGRSYESKIVFDLICEPKYKFSLKMQKDYIIASLPYIDRKLPFSLKDKEVLKQIVNYFDKIHIDISYNRQFLKKELRYKNTN